EEKSGACGVWEKLKCRLEDSGQHCRLAAAGPRVAPQVTPNGTVGGGALGQSCLVGLRQRSSRTIEGIVGRWARVQRHGYRVQAKMLAESITLLAFRRQTFASIIPPVAKPFDPINRMPPSASIPSPLSLLLELGQALHSTLELDPLL